MTEFLSVLPILILILISLIRGVKEAVTAGLAVTIILFFYWGASFNHFIGAVGTFVTGSTTISNIVFAPSQLQAANFLELPAVLILSLQHLGAGLGNAICLFNIIAAASVANLQNYKEVLKLNLVPVIVGCALFGMAGLVIISVFN